MYKSSGLTPKRPSARTKIHAIRKFKLKSKVIRKSSGLSDSKTGDNSDNGLSPYNSLTKGNASLFDKAEIDDDKIKEKPSELNIPKARKLTIHNRKQKSISKNGEVMQTYKQGVRLSSMQRLWEPLNPGLQAQLKSILEMFIEDALSLSGVSNDKEKLQFRNIMRLHLIRFLMRRFKRVKLPPGIKSDHLDQEQLTEDKLRLGSNYDANLRQLQELKSQLLEEEQQLKSQEAYLKKYSFNAKDDKNSMIKSMHDAESLLKPSDIPIPQHIIRSGNETYNIVTASLPKRNLTDVDDDKKLKNMLLKVYKNISDNTEGKQEHPELTKLNGLLDQVGNMMELLKESK